MTMKLWKTLTMGSGNRNGTDSKTVPSSKIHSNWADIYELEDMKRSTSASPDSGLPGERFARRVVIYLDRRRGKALGLILAGRSEPGLLPTIAGFKKESAAHEADRFAPGDRISSINGIGTARLTNDEVISLLDNVEERASLEVEYYLPNYDSQSSLCVTTRIAQIPVERQGGSLGVTLRSGGIDTSGCAGSNGNNSASVAVASNCRGPLMVTHVRPGGPAHATARIKPGDRIIKADNISLANKTLAEAYQILQNTPTVTNLTIEYDISIMESVKFATGPLLIEIERGCNESLGILLTDKSYNEECFGDNSNYQQGDGQCGIYIESIIPATIADRCGALHPGDQLLAIDDLVIENSTYNPEEVMCYMENCSGKGFTQLQILPVHMLLKNYRMSKLRGLPPGSPISGMSTLNSRKSHRQNRQLRQSSVPKSFEMDPDFLHNNFVTGVGVCRSEVLSLQLDIPPNHDSGITVCEDRDLLLISHISHQFPAYRCGCLQLGDRVLSINSQQNLTAVAANDILQKINDTSSTKHLYITTEFSMADSVEASSGVFNVKLAKNGAGLGVTITGNKQRGTNSEEPMIISNIKVGSVAYRSGTLAVGDQLIAIDSQPLHNLSLDTAFEILQNFPDDIITLTVRKTDKKHDQSDVRMRNGNISYSLNEPTPSVNSSTKSGSMYSHTLQMKNQFANNKREPTEDRSVQMELNERETVFELELVKHNEGPLGLTVAGSEDASTPIVLSGLVKGGLAERSEVLQIGDRILSINGESVNQKPLSDAIKMLQNSPHRVLLKVSRKLSNAATSKMTIPVKIENVESYGSRDSNTFTNNSQSSPGLASIDSAVESWDSQPTISNIARDNTTGLDETPQQSQGGQFKAANDNRISYLPTDENKLLASGYRISDTGSCDMNELQMPNYSFTNTLRTFKTDNPSGLFQSDKNNGKTKFNDRFTMNNQNFEALNNFEIPASSNNHKANYCDDNVDFYSKFDSKEGSCKSENSGHKQYNLNPPKLKSSFVKAHDNTSDGGSSRGNNGFHVKKNEVHNVSNLNYQISTTSYQFNSNQNYDMDIPGFYNMDPIANQGTIHHVTLYKDVIYDDYGFSVSDGLYERGVYINRIRKGGPADIVGLLKPYDRILQVNGTRTVDFDCCLTVPLIASAGDRIELVLQRLQDCNSWSEDNNSNIMETSSIVTKTI